MIRYLSTFIIFVVTTQPLAPLHGAEREYRVSQSIPHDAGARVGGTGKVVMSTKRNDCFVVREDLNLVSVFTSGKQGWQEASRLGRDAVSSPTGLALGPNSTTLLLELGDRNVSVYKLNDADELKFQAKTQTSKAGRASYRDLVLHPSGRWFYFVANFTNQLWGGALSAKDVPALTQCFEGENAGGAAQTISGISLVSTPGLNFPHSPVVSPDGKDLYVACARNHSVAHFRIQAETGALTFVRHVKTEELDKNHLAVRAGLTCPYSMGISLDGTLLVVGGAGKGAAVFMRDPATGTLAQGASLLPGSTIGNIAAIRLSPNDKYLAVVCRDENYIELFVRTGIGKFTFETTLTDSNLSLPVLSHVSDVGFSRDSKQLIVTSDASLLATIELEKK